MEGFFMVDEKKKKLEGEEEQTEEPRKKKGKGLLLIIIIAVVAIAGGIGAFVFFSKPGEDKAAIKETKKVEEGVMFALEPFTVNLTDPRGARFLRVALYLELAGPAVAEMAKARTPQIRDAIITLLTAKTSEELIHPEGKLQLKDEINIRINQILGENAVRDVFLTDFVMQ
jgi:flagellar FliL protein